MGGQDILRRYLTFFFWVQTWQFGFYRKKRQRERPPVMTIRSSASSYRRGDVLHIILTWASCLAYLCRRQPRPVPRVSKSMTPTSFFVPVRVGRSPDRKLQYVQQFNLSSCFCRDGMGYLFSVLPNKQPSLAPIRKRWIKRRFTFLF